MKLALRVVIAASGLILAAGLAWIFYPPGPLKTTVFNSEDYHIDRIYKSMTGPKSAQKIYLEEGIADPELLWVTGYRVRMIDSDSGSRLGDEFMCHVNVDLTTKITPNIVRSNASKRMVSLSQGLVDVDLPEGFGFPILSDEPVEVGTQVLNLNRENPGISTRHRVEIDYVKHADLEEPLVPLFMTAAWGLKLVKGSSRYYNKPDGNEEDHGPGCLPGVVAFNQEHDYVRDRFGNDFTGHWVVKPGREVNHTLVTNLLKIPYDTTVHYITIHIHPFAESLELRDLTADETVFLARIENFKDRIGIAKVDQLVSREGIPIYKDHEYELISVYENTTDEDQDAMAVMYLYAKDRGFRVRQPA